MIPKQIFFLWFGNKKPNYIKYVINAFKKVNSDFKVDLINYTTEQLENWENCNDEVLKETIKELKSGKRYNPYMPLNNKFITVHLSDTYRRKLLNKYGGIYLDCDTFPVRPFNNHLLSNISFKTKVIRLKNHVRWVRVDTFFCGSIKGHFTQQDEKIMTRVPYVIDNKKLKIFYKYRYYFLRCQLKKSFNSKPMYIDHYERGDWIKNRKQQILDIANILD